MIILLSLYSLLSVYSTSGILMFRNPGSSPTHYVFRHGILLMAGLFMVYLTHLVPYKYFSRLSQFLVILVVPMLIATLILGKDVNQASRWLEVPGLGFTFQTSDLAKLALIMFVARLLSQKQNEIKDLKKAFMPIIIPIGLICLLIMPEDLSTALILMATCIILMYIGRIKLSYLLLLCAAGILFIGLFAGISTMAHKEGRVGTWENRMKSYFDKEAENYQVEQAKIAIASGGILENSPGTAPSGISSRIPILILFMQ